MLGQTFPPPGGPTMPLRQALLASAALPLLAGAAQAFTLHVAHFNDFHSRIESINAFESTCSGEDEAAGECFGGAARLVTAVNALRDEMAAKGEPIIVLEAGDAFQGSLFFTAYSGQAEAEMLNRIGLDAMVYGNHEFDLGPEPLAKFIDAAEFPVISGSADVSADNLLAPHALDRVLLDIEGEKVAILGAVTPDTPEISSPGPSVTFRPPVDYLRAQVAALQAEGIDKIILLSHLGELGDRAVAAAVPGIDLIVGGHSHTLFSNTAEDAPFKYPLMADGPDGEPVPIVQAGAYSKYLGHITLTFDDEGRVTDATGDTRLLDASVTPDPATLTRIEELAGPIEELKSRVVAEIPAGIDGSRETCRSQECPMGSLIADAMVDRVKDQGVTIGLQNGGGVRASIGAGAVTMGDVLAVLPFQNTLSTFNIPGSGIVAALENGVSQVEEGAGRFPQVSGLRFSWDPKAPAMSRIRTVEVRDGDGWVPIDPSKVYTVASNNFMRAGGDGYVSLRDQATNAYDYGPGLEEVLADYLAAHPDYTPGPEPRITRVE
jgi:5'-nucleotidase/UDP-sugar diphosphatase